MQFQILVRYHYSAGTLLVVQFERREQADAAYRQLEKEGGRHLTAVKLYEPGAEDKGVDGEAVDV